MTKAQVLSQAPRTDGGMNAANINGAPVDIVTDSNRYRYQFTADAEFH